MKTETKLIMELCKFKNADRSLLLELLNKNPDLPYTLGQLLYNRAGGVAYHILENSGLMKYVNREFRNTLSTVYQANIGRTMSRRVVVDSLNTMLDDTGIPYALLKGAWLCYEYPIGCRTSNDTDILIDSGSISDVSELLRANGYEQGYLKNGVFSKATRREIIESRMTRGETVPFVKRVSFPGMEYSEVDLNFSLDYKNDDNSCVSRILGRSVTRSSGTHYVRTLDKYDFVLHLCAHLYKEAVLYPWVKMGRDLQLYKFIDIYAMLYDWNESDCVRLYRRLDEFDMFKECYFALVYTDALFGLDNPHVYTLMEDLPLEFDDDDVMNTVISPSDRKKYRYTSGNLRERVLRSDRLSSLAEVKV